MVILCVSLTVNKSQGKTEPTTNSANKLCVYNCSLIDPFPTSLSISVTLGEIFLYNQWHSPTVVYFHLIYIYKCS